MLSSLAIVTLLLFSNTLTFATNSAIAAAIADNNGSAQNDDAYDNTLIIIIASLSLVIIGAIVGISILVKNSSKDRKGTKSAGDHGVKVLTGSMIGHTAKITEGETINIGKDPNFANLVLTPDYVNVSRKHCTITLENRTYYVTDCSSNGTYFVNGRQLAKGTLTPVKPGTTLHLANDKYQIKLM